MVIAFDFDSTITNKQVQKLANKFVSQGNEIWIVTARRDNDYNVNTMLSELKGVKITNHQFLFSNSKPKYEILKDINADLYIDNITDEFEMIQRHTNTIPLLFTNFI